MDKLDKKSLRKLGLARRRALSAAERREKSHLIAARILFSEALQAAQTVFCYVSTEDEVHTEEILFAVLKAGKELYVPYITDSKNGLMEAVRLRDVADLTEGAFGILTAPSENRETISPEKIDLVLVPGAAFDAAGHRIGMGGGYYDRFLTKTSAQKVALAYECQIFAELPVEAHDKKVDAIFTE